MPWREPPGPLAVLREAGVAAPDVLATAELEDVSRSHSVTYARLPGSSGFVVKRVSAGAHAAGRSLAAELFAYRLASWNPRLASVLPEPVHLDERNQVLALVASLPEHLYPAQCLDPGFPSPQLAAALGRALAALHGATENLPLANFAACGIFELPDADPEDRRPAGGSAAAAALAQEVAVDETFAASLRGTRRLLRPGCLVHGDLKWDNCILVPGPSAEVRLFDWELSGRGDPAWDVGAALADTLALQVRLRGAGALPLEPDAWLSPAARALLVAYRGSADVDLAKRVAGCWVGRMIQLALECASSLEDAQHPLVRELLAVARRLDGDENVLIEGIDVALSAAA